MLFICCVRLLFFFFKQKTAYEMRISDWSSDVCSSDLARRRNGRRRASASRARLQREVNLGGAQVVFGVDVEGALARHDVADQRLGQIALRLAEGGHVEDVHGAVRAVGLRHFLRFAAEVLRRVGLEPAVRRGAEGREGRVLEFRHAEHERAPAFGEERSEEHTSELQSLMRNSYAVFCLKKKRRIS